MDLTTKNFLDRSENELIIAETLRDISNDSKKKEFLKIPLEISFYSAVISHSYYAIFYSAKAILLTKDIKTTFPEVHKKTYDEFDNNFVKTGIIDVKLLEIYQKMIIRADHLLEIFKDLKFKRGLFTYQTISQANKEYAEDSLKNAKLFVNNITKIVKIIDEDIENV